MTDSLSALGLSTAGMDEIFSPASIVEHMLTFESALALALADNGLVPSEHAEAIEVACGVPAADPEAVLASTWSSGTPVIALVEAIRLRLSDDEQRKWVHYGATSQDVVDTAHMLLAKRAFFTMEAPLVGITRHLRRLVEENRYQPQIGRTFLQHATATTFGIRVATWLAPLLDHVLGLRALAESLPVQLGGPVGNLAAYGEKGTDVVEALAGRLDLRAPEIAWHTDRSVVWRLAGLVRTMVMTLEKIAADVSLLAASDVAELLVRSGGSSSITGKRNPIDAIRVMASAAVSHGAVEMITRARPHELDRGMGSWHAEWVGIPLMFRSAGAAIEASEAMFETMEVDDAAMTGRVDAESARSLGDLDERQIDAVLTRFDEVIGRR